MSFKFFHMTLFGFALTSTLSCSNNSGSNNSRPPATAAPTPTTVPDGNATTCTPTPENNNCQPAISAVDKCWQKILQTPEFVSCSGQQKLFNRVTKGCVDLGIRVTTSCSIPEADLANGKNTINTALGGESGPAIEQCGQYTANGKNYLVAYMIGKKFTPSAAGSEAAGVGSYRFHSSLVCYFPGTTGGNATCADASLKLSGGTPTTVDSNLVCD